MRSIARWLQEAGLVGQPRRRTRRGPAVPHPGLTVPRRRHQVWTVDFKGWYRTADGWEVYLGTLLIGELHAADPAPMRPATWARFPKTKK